MNAEKPAGEWLFGSRRRSRENQCRVGVGVLVNGQLAEIYPIDEEVVGSRVEPPRIEVEHELVGECAPIIEYIVRRMAVIAVTEPGPEVTHVARQAVE